MEMEMRLQQKFLFAPCLISLKEIPEILKRCEGRVYILDVDVIILFVGQSVTQVYNMNSKPESVRKTPRFHHSVLSTTRSHRQLVKAVKIWKTAFVSSSNVTPGALKPRSFKERLMCVEMHRKASEVSTAPKSIACSIRDLQLCSSDSSPSPFKRPLESQHTRRRRPVHRRHYRKQLEWFHTLSRNKRPPRLILEVCDIFISVCRTYTSVSLDHPQCTSVFTGSKVTDSCQDDGLVLIQFKLTSKIVLPIQ